MRNVSACHRKAVLARPLFACPHGHFRPVDIEQRVQAAEQAENG